jgi:hypothetical protein
MKHAPRIQHRVSYETRFDILHRATLCNFTSKVCFAIHIGHIEQLMVFAILACNQLK